MKQESGITLVALVVTVIILMILAGISMNTLIGDNGIITKAKQAKQNITLAGEAEAMQLNQLYYELETGGELSEDEESSKKDEMISLLQKQVEDLQNQLNSLNSLLSQTNSTADKILAGYKAYSGGQLVTGTMPNNGGSGNIPGDQAWLYIDRVYFGIPYGYYPPENYGGMTQVSERYVTFASLANTIGLVNNKLAVGQSVLGINGTYTSDANATANNLSSGTTAYVNGQKITGNGADVNNAYNNGYNAGYAAGNNAGKSALKSATYSFNNKLNGSKSVSYNTGKQLVAVMLKSCSYNVYGWQQNYNAYVGAGASCSFSGSTLSVNFPSSHTDDTNTGGGTRTTSFTVEYFYFE